MHDKTPRIKHNLYCLICFQFGNRKCVLCLMIFFSLRRQCTTSYKLKYPSSILKFCVLFTSNDLQNILTFCDCVPFDCKVFSLVFNTIRGMYAMEVKKSLGL